jgi:undecaprenyl-diphosphatase
MKNGNRISLPKLAVAAGFLAAFVVWTILVRLVDVQAIGPEGSSVGFATLNGWFHRTVGVHTSLYNITDTISILPLAIIGGFGILGLVQVITRKSLLKVDRSILALGGFYVAVLAVFLLFEVLDVNYRPVLIEGVLEASYPSSTTMLAISVLSTAALQFRDRIPNRALRICVIAVTIALMVFMVVGRIISGVHWITDIIGGALFSVAAVLAYDAFSRK